MDVGPAGTTSSSSLCCRASFFHAFLAWLWLVPGQKGRWGPAEHEVATGAAGALEVSDKEFFE